MKKDERQKLINDVVSQNKIETQEELLKQLKAVGVDATQATISRDMRELSIIKGRGINQTSHYQILDSDYQQWEQLGEAISESVERLSSVQFMVVVQTYLGSANILAALIDELQLSGIAGTLAGANTLAIITDGNESAQQLEKKMASYLQ